MNIMIKSFNVAGVKYRPADVIDPLVSGDKIRFIKEPTNVYDSFAIKIEAKFEYEKDANETFPEYTEPVIEWKLIGYVPKKETWIYHILRKAKIPIKLSLIVNQDASDEDKLLVTVSIDGDENNEFICN